MRPRFSYANVAATLALVFSMSSGAMAASHYLITSTKQIKPGVLAQLKGDRGPAGTSVAGPQGAAGPGGPAGAEGAAGPRGAAGANGIDGATGAQGAPGTAAAKGETGATGPTGEGGASGNN